MVRAAGSFLSSRPSSVQNRVNSTIDHTRQSEYDGPATNPRIVTGFGNIQIKENAICRGNYSLQQSF